MKTKTVLFCFLSILTIYACSPKTNISSSSASKTSGASIAEEDLAKIYQESVTEMCYEYSFSETGPSTAFNGLNFREYKGGIKGLLLYCSFGDAVAKYLNEIRKISPDQWSHKFDDMKKIQLLAGGIDAFQDGRDDFYAWGLKKDGKQDFHRYNRAIVKWGHNNLIPNPKTMIGNLTAQELYDSIFRRFFRLMAESHYYLQQQGARAESAKYKEAYSSENKNMIKYLKTTYEGKLAEYDEVDGIAQMTGHQAIGFWCRRNIDGSAVEINTGLKKVMNAYDRTWYNTFSMSNRMK